MDRRAFVYMDYPAGPVLVGRLWSVSEKAGKARASNTMPDGSCGLIVSRSII